MVDAKFSNRQGRYYTPAARIVLIAGVERSPLPFHGIKQGYPTTFADLYVGSADDLERCGLLRPDMLPTPPAYSIAWRPHGDEPQEDEKWFHVPGYVEIRRHPTGLYHVHLTVSREERAVRQSAWEEEERARDVEIERFVAARNTARAQEAPRHPTNTPPTGKGHLRLVWSAP